MSLLQKLTQILLGKPDTTVVRTVLYDADCGFCQHSMMRFKRLGADAAMTFVPSVQAEALIAKTTLTEDDLGKGVAMIVQDAEGNILTLRYGADCVNGILRLLPGFLLLPLRILGSLYLLPVIKQVENWGYQHVSDNRHHISRLMGYKACPIS